MGSDLLALSALAAELNIALSGARIDKIVQPEVDEVRFYLRANGKNLCLCVSCNSGAPRLHLTEAKKQNPVTAPALCMLLRKHLAIGAIESVSIFDNDRIIDIKFVARTEMRDDASYHMFVELMNRYSNIVFTDGNLTILDAVKHLPLDENSNHIVLRGVKYTAVGQAKTSYLTAQNSILDSFCGGDLHKYILDSISGFSGVTASEFLARAGVNSEHPSPLSVEEKNALSTVLNEFKDICNTPYFSPCVMRGKDVYPFPYSILDGEAIKYPTMSAAYEALYTEADGAIRQKARLKTASTALKHLKARVEKNIKTDLERLHECEDMESYRIKGELIVSNIYKIAKGDKELVCIDYYTNEEVKIKLDEQLSPSKNSAAYYAKYNKLKRQKEFTEKKLTSDRLLLEYVTSIEQELNSLPIGASSTAIEDELAALGAYKKKAQKSKVRKEKPEPPYSYDINGYTVLRGKNNLQNDELTFRIANSSDIWLHVKNAHGAHVIILANGKQVPDSIIMVAAEIAACSHTAAVEVDYTERRNVKRQPNGHPGQVIYVNYKTAVATPNEHKELFSK